ncbi:MAG TPA: hypothetical protein VNZ03_04055 [Terriglobales bacterium]|jgi:hypothetical protein|nr:hypothetical protein [Terriglobales bacterium]
MFLTINGVTIELENLSDAQANEIRGQLRKSLSNPTLPPRQAIYQAFALGTQSAPSANPSDIWHHIIYREYLQAGPELRRMNSASQSWVRASGDALELFWAQRYNERLADFKVRVIPLFGAEDASRALAAMGINAVVTGSKLDLAIWLGDEIIGGIHSKVSLAERVSDDVPASRAMMERGYLSILATLDVKSFPLSAIVREARAYINRGELGTRELPSDKRLYVERDGFFDLCASFNYRTVPTPPDADVVKRIYTIHLDEAGPDAIEKSIRARAADFAAPAAAPS